MKAHAGMHPFEDDGTGTCRGCGGEGIDSHWGHHARPVTEAELAPFRKVMEEETIPAIVEAVKDRAVAAAKARDTVLFTTTELARAYLVNAGDVRGRAVVEILLAQVEQLMLEVARLKDGRFTSEEVQEFCHTLPETVPPLAFAAGCAAYQRQLYGCAPDADVARVVTTPEFAAAVTEYLRGLGVLMPTAGMVHSAICGTLLAQREP